MPVPLLRKSPPIERAIVTTAVATQPVVPAHNRDQNRLASTLSPINPVIIGATAAAERVAVNGNLLRNEASKVVANARVVVDPTMIRRQLRSARAFGSPEHHEYGNVNFYQVHKMCDWGDMYASTGDWRNAVLVYITILDELLTHHEGVLPGYDVCIHGLQNALVCMDEALLRRQILQTLLQAWLWDVKQGGLGVGNDISETILAGALPTEKKMVAEWLQNEVILEAEASANCHWRRPIYGGFLLALQGDVVDDETYLRIARQTGRTAELLDRLLALQRLEETIELASRASDHDITHFADIYVKRNQGALAVRLLEERVCNQASNDLLAWLKNYFVTASNPERAFTYARLLFRQNPTLAGYLELYGLVADEDRWRQVRGELEQWLQNENRWELLARIHLKSGTPDKTIQAIRNGKDAQIW